MRTRLIAKPEAAFRVVEAAHDGHGDWNAWAARILDAAAPLLTTDNVNVGIGQRREHAYELIGAASRQPETLRYFLTQVPKLDPTTLDGFWRYPHLVGSSHMVIGDGATPVAMSDFEASVGAEDVLGIVAIADDISLSIGAPYKKRFQIGARERHVLSQVALHLEAGLRFRNQPNEVVAVLGADGRLLHARGALREPASRGRLARHVNRVEKSRSRRTGRDDSALAAWTALVAGEWGLVERDERGSGRHYAVLETKRARHLRALTSLETHATELSARGLTGKMVAYALGVTAATVSKALSSAALKLGLGTRTSLVQLVARLLATGPQPHDEPQLTAAERDVLSLVRLGWTNKAIALSRARSERTVANQVASLLRKLQVPSRRALAASLSDR